MIYACDECGQRLRLTRRCAIGDGPRICFYCRQRKAHTLYSRYLLEEESRSWWAIKFFLLLPVGIVALIVEVARLIEWFFFR